MAEQSQGRSGVGAHHAGAPFSVRIEDEIITVHEVHDFGTSGGYLIPIEALPLLAEAARREDRRRHNWAMRAYTDRLLDSSESLAYSLYGHFLPPSVSRYLSRRERVLDDVDPAGIGEPGPW